MLSRFQLALVPSNLGMWYNFRTLAQVLESDTHFPRVCDVPLEVNAGSLAAVVHRMLRNDQLPFAVVAVTGSAAEIEKSQLIFHGMRKRVPSVLIMCPSGYAHMKAVTDLPSYAIGNPPRSYDIRLAILLGDPDKFGEYDEQMFGPAFHFVSADPEWNGNELADLAAKIRGVAYPANKAGARVTC